jgi:hypothetical protein
MTFGSDAWLPDAFFSFQYILEHKPLLTGLRMDLYDLECYFAYQVPIQSITNPLLKYAACAYAAKQLSRVHGHKPAVGGAARHQAHMELFGEPGKIDWLYVAAKYYDKAISLLMEELANSGGAETHHSLLNVEFSDRSSTPRSLGDSSITQGHVSSSPSNKRRRLSSSPLPADETLAAAAILCVYEFLDYTSTAWARHLSGTKSLFDLADSHPMLSRRNPPSRARKAIFWNFARQDFLAACK